MVFNEALQVDRGQMARALGYHTTAPDSRAAAQMETAAEAIERAAQPRWCWVQLPLVMEEQTAETSLCAEANGLAAQADKNVQQKQNDKAEPETLPKMAAGKPEENSRPQQPEVTSDKTGEILPARLLLGAGRLPLPGRDIALHLAGCSHCLVLALTLGVAADAGIRAAEASDMGKAVLMDTAASTLAEQYADLATGQLQAELASERGKRYLTGRYSPGYGDLPLALQAPLLALANAQRAIGLTASASHILLPRKSITALIGVAAQPVSGHLAGCRGCALWEKCRGTAGCARQ